MQVGRQPIAGNELDLLAGASPAAAWCSAGQPVADGGEAQVLDRLARKVRMRRGRRLAHRDEPLVGQHRLDDLAGASAARHDHLVRLSRETTRPAAPQIGQHRLARRVAIEAAVFRRRVVVDRRVEIEDRDRGQVVPLADRPVVEVVRRRDLDARRCRTRGRRNHRRSPESSRSVSGSAHALADECAIALVVGMHGDRGVAQHRLGSRGRDDHRCPEPSAQRIATVSQSFPCSSSLSTSRSETAVISLGSQLTSRLPR